MLGNRVKEFFDGPTCSPFMNFLHYIKDHKTQLLALSHPDNSTRVQTIDVEDDRYLFEVLNEFEAITGFPILVNTSFNGHFEPLVNSASQAVNLYRRNPLIDYLILGKMKVTREPEPFTKNWAAQVYVSDDVVISSTKSKSKSLRVATNGRAAIPISDSMVELLFNISENSKFVEIECFAKNIPEAERITLIQLFDFSFLQIVEDSRVK